MATIVSIGRNVGTETGHPRGKLTALQWRHFKRDVADAVGVYAGPIVFAGNGSGQDPVSGMAEDSFTIIGGDDVAGLRAARFAMRLGTIAGRYGQESVALTVGPTTFPGPTLAPLCLYCGSDDVAFSDDRDAASEYPSTAARVECLACGEAFRLGDARAPVADGTPRSPGNPHGDQVT